jgi:hypothetical protein
MKFQGFLSESLFTGLMIAFSKTDYQVFSSATLLGTQMTLLMTMELAPLPRQDCHRSERTLDYALAP